MGKEQTLLSLRSLGSISILSAFFLSGFPQIGIGILGLVLLLLASFVAVEQGKQEVFKEIQDSFPDILLPKDWVLSQLGESVSRLWVDVEHMQSILDSIQEGVLAFDNEGRVVFFNQRARTLLKVELRGNRLSELKLPKDIHRLCAEKLPESTWVWKQGSRAKRKYLQISYFDWFPGSLIVVRDITKIHKLERVRSDFFANVSHELKTPITIIQANTETLLDGAYKDETMAVSFLQSLLRNSHRLGDIVSGMLELAQLEAGTYELQLRTFSLSQIVQTTIELFLPEALKKEQSLTCITSKEVFGHVDERVLSHILGNYIENAIKYTPSKGSIELSIQAKKKMVYIYVDDSGPGIKPKHTKRVFERFFRIDKGRTRLAGGTGLGLSIVRNLAISMNAKVGVKKSHLGGACFWCAVERQDVS